jgi:hypothetical protein
MVEVDGTHGDNAAIYEALSVPFPAAAVKQRKGGGGKMLSYLAGDTVIRRLNAVAGRFAISWSFEVQREVQEANLLLCIGRLTFGPLGYRDAKGVQRIDANGGEDLHKGAITDALKKAATLFGVGLELYGEDFEAGHSEPADTSTTSEEIKAHNARIAPKAEPAHSAPIACADCGSVIKDSPNFPAEKKAAVSTSKHGRVLCYACSVKATK